MTGEGGVKKGENHLTLYMDDPYKCLQRKVCNFKFFILCNEQHLNKD